MLKELGLERVSSGGMILEPYLMKYAGTQQTTKLGQQNNYRSGKSCVEHITNKVTAALTFLTLKFALSDLWGLREKVFGLVSYIDFLVMRGYKEDSYFLG